MKKINATKLTYLILSILFFINIILFLAGVLPPAGRVYYLPEFIVNMTTTALWAFLFVTPGICLAGILIACIQTLRKRLSSKAFWVFGVLFAAQFLFWHLFFQMLMGI